MRRPGDSDHREATATTQIGQLDPAPPSGQHNACLIVIGGLDVGRLYRIDRREIVLGRSSRAHLRLEDDLISRRHARVRLENGEVQIEDMQSANGILVNGARVSRHTLKDGDKIRLGANTILKFTYTDELDEVFQRQMYDAALRDGLTGAFNKTFFHQRLDAEVAFAKRHLTPLVLLVMDVDHFKRVNDTHGHPAGDLVLTRFADLVSKLLRTEDVFARYGGEEFAVLCRGIAGVGALKVAERIRATIEGSRFETPDGPLSITCSIGIACFPELSIESGNDLLARADGALLAAKREGRNRAVIARGA